MTRAWVVFESFFGNGRAIATAVADALALHMEVDLIPVDEAPTIIPDDVTLIVAGGPTHTFTLSRPQTRAEAVKTGGDGTFNVRRGLREWLPALERPSHPVFWAAYGTHADAPVISRLRIVESAIERRFRRLGMRPAAQRRESFLVGGMQGPLVPGELARALRWGDELGGAVTRGAVAEEILSVA
jgi:hypothetical protein